MRWIALVLCSLSVMACRASNAPTRAMKEVFVEPQSAGLTPLTDWPFTPEDEERCYEAARSLSEGRTESQRKLAMLIDQWVPPKRQADGSIAPLSTVVVINRDDYPEGLPDLLFFPARDDVRSGSAVYVGHSVYRRDPWRPGSDLSHHLRFLVVNRESFGLRLPVSGIELGVTASADTERANLGGDFSLVAAANARGEAIRTLYVEPGGRALIHVFYRSRRLGRAIHLRWLVEEGEAPVGAGLGVVDESGSDGSEGELAPDPAAEPAKEPDLGPVLRPEPERPADGGGGELAPEGAPRQGGEAEEGGGPARPAGPPLEEEPEHRWKFYAVLQRRYVIAEGVVTPLEQRVAAGEPLPEPANGDYTEPRVTPLAPR